VDEAGMVSGRQMEGLLKLAKREDARILFSGDTRQLQSVEASDDREQLREMLGVTCSH
jgi:ATP-dependent exoDNAse (exonuclease V) alpha subunit